jgi:hypothetical protein
MRTGISYIDEYHTSVNEVVLIVLEFERFREIRSLEGNIDGKGTGKA